MRLHTASPFIPASILLSLLALSSAAQQPQSAQPPRDHDPNAMDSTTTDPVVPAPAMTPEQVTLIERYLTPVHAQVAGKVDTRTAAAGQGITLEVTDDATLANGTPLPRGTKLIGHILRAQAFEKDASAAAFLSVNIDHAVLRDGSTVPIRCVLRTVASSSGGPSARMADASQDGSHSSRAGIAAPLSSPLGGGGYPIGGSVGGDIGAGPADDGASAGSLGGPASPVGGPINGSAYPGSTSRTGVSSNRGGGSPSPVGGGDPGVGGSSTTIGDRTGAALGQTGTAVAAAGPELPVTQAGVDLHDAPRRTGLPGVMLSGASTVGISGTLSAFDRNITLDSSTRLTLGIITR